MKGKSSFYLFLVFCFSLVAYQSIPSNAADGKASAMKMIGTALAEFSVFKIDVYQISYFQGEVGQEKMVLDYKRDVEKKYSIMGWEKGLESVLEKNPSYRKQYDWIIKHTVDLKKGDQFKILRIQDKVSFYKNSSLIAESEDKVLAKLVFLPWIGVTPVDEDIKQKLLKGLNEKASSST